ncbi:hypothetical protein KY328_00555 [Candidatus Woesearchaeota archaeon]|nr:hypothetical protein [Candidatus Woesearchaeota archaeon]MBW3021387.1 hypothetical protein [Candidatus Woesearchaeota archaeon]
MEKIKANSPDSEDQIKGMLILDRGFLQAAIYNGTAEVYGTDYKGLSEGQQNYFRNLGYAIIDRRASIRVKDKDEVAELLVDMRQAPRD